MCFPEPHADSAPCWLLSVNPSNGWVYLLLCRCSNLTTEALEADVASRHDDDSVRKLLSLPPSSGGDVTAECIASNHMGAVSKVFHHRMLLENTTVAYFQSHIWADVIKNKICLFCFPGGRHTAFMPALIGAVSTAAILFLLLLVVFYKWRQVWEQ